MNDPDQVAAWLSGGEASAIVLGACLAAGSVLLVCKWAVRAIRAAW